MGVTVDGVEYDIALERSTGERMGFMIVPHSDRRERVNDWAPAIATTGDLAYAEGVWRPWTQEDWSGGLGQEVWDSAEAARFLEAENVETRISGKVMLATATTLSDPNFHGSRPTDLGAKIYMAPEGSHAVRQYTSATPWWYVGWYAAVKGPVSDLRVFGDSMYIASASSRYSRISSAGTLLTGAVDREYFATWNPSATPSLYGSHGHQIFASTNGSTWGDAIDIGDSSASINSMAVFDQKLYVGKDDGLYFYDGANAFKMIDCATRLSANNFTMMSEWEGFLYFNILRRIYKYSSSAVVDITPNAYGTVTKESYDYGQPKAIVASPTSLYVGFDLAENDYPCVLSYTGAGWHPVWKGASGNTFYGMGYSPEFDWLLINDTDGTRIRPLVSQTDYPYPSFCLTAGATGSITTPRFDAGMPMTPKAVKSVALRTRDCVADAQYIAVEYRIGAATAWTSAGTISSSPTEELSLDAIAGAVEVPTDIQFRFILTSTSPAHTPVLEHMAVNYLPRPAAIFAHQVSVRLGTPIPL